MEGSIVVGKVLENSSATFGFNAQTEAYVDMISAGIIDPAKVVRTALQDAASVAGLMITTEAAIVEAPKKAAGGGMPGGQPPDQSQPPPDAGAAPPAPVPPGTIVRGGAGTRGFTITLKCTSPYGQAPRLVNKQLLANLMNIWPSQAHPHMEYGVAKAMIVSDYQVGQDQPRLNDLQKQYQNALQAKRIADAAAAAAKMAAQQAMAAQNPAAGGARPNPYGTPPPVPYFPDQAGAPGAAVVANPLDAYNDRLTGEDMRPDWEFTILVAVQLDPPTFVPPPSTAPAGQTASAAGGPAIGQ